jgi:cytochrome c oxidase cbb3-type subunit 4
MDMGIVRGLITLTILVLFVGIWAWSWSRNRHTEFDAAAKLPLGDDRSRQ